MEIIEIIKQTLAGILTTFGETLVKLAGALVVLLIGWLIAKIVKWGVKKLLKTINFDGITARLGINNFLVKGGITTAPSSLGASLFYWLIMLVVLVTFFNSLGLEVVSKLLNDVILFIPNIIISCVLFILGMYLADFVRTLVVTALRGSGSDYADLAGRLVHAAVVFFTVAVILTQLNIGTEIIETLVQVVVGGAGLAFAIAFGLGGKDWAKDLVDKYLRK
jgi:hypothetical protein